MAKKPLSIFGYFFSAGAAIVLVLALTGPGYAQGLMWYEALAFHGVSVLVPLGIALAMAKFAAARMSGGRVVIWLMLALCGIGAALISGPALILAEMVFTPQDIDGDAVPSAQTVRAFLSLSAREGLEVVPVVTCVWLALNAGINWAVGAPAENMEPAASHAPPIFKYIPSRLGSDIVSLTAEQHYMMLKTTAGSAYFLYALRDAITELEAAGYEGIRCHRSAWIAVKHAKTFRQEGPKAWAEMYDGSRIPISRRRRSAVKKAMS